jgi:hypothetical protein
MTRRPVRLRVEVPAAPRPALLRAAIAARVAGRAFPSPAEDAVGARVAAAVREQLGEERRQLSAKRGEERRQLSAKRGQEGSSWR